MHWSLSLIVFSFPITSHWELNKNAPTVSYVYTSTHHSAWRSNHSETICCGEDLQTAANTIKQPRRPIQQFGSSDLGWCWVGCVVSLHTMSMGMTQGVRWFGALTSSSAFDQVKHSCHSRMLLYISNQLFDLRYKAAFCYGKRLTYLSLTVKPLFSGCGELDAGQDK